VVTVIAAGAGPPVMEAFAPARSDLATIARCPSLLRILAGVSMGSRDRLRPPETKCPTRCGEDHCDRVANGNVRDGSKFVVDDISNWEGLSI